MSSKIGASDPRYRQDHLDHPDSWDQCRQDASRHPDAEGASRTLEPAGTDKAAATTFNSANGHLSVVAGVIGGSGVPVVGPATSSPLENPYGLAVDSAGDIYIAMTYYFGPSFAGNVIRVVKVTSSGQLSFYAGNGSYGAEVAGPALSSPMTDPGALAVDSTGDLYIADAGGMYVYKVTP